MTHPIKSWRNRIKHQFLLTFFDEGNYYQEIEVNGFVLIKQLNAVEMQWEVAIYTQSAYLKRYAHQFVVNKLLTSRRNKQKRD